MVHQNKIKILSKRLFEACKILDSKYSDYKIIQGIKKENPGIKLSAGYFSKYKRAHKNRNYISQIKEGNYEKFFDYIDSIIEKEFGYKWDEGLKQYVQIKDFIKSPVNPDQQELINKFVGVWKGYSWNKAETKNTEKINPAAGVTNNHYNIYRLEITKEGEVICETKNGLFKNGKVEPITEDRVFIKLEMIKRKIFLVAKLGISKQGAYDNLTLAYLDSGNDHVKCGLTTIKRVNVAFDSDEIKPDIVSREYFNGHTDEKIIKLLTETQNVAD